MGLSNRDPLNCCFAGVPAFGFQVENWWFRTMLTDIRQHVPGRLPLREESTCLVLAATCMHVAYAGSRRVAS